MLVYKKDEEENITSIIKTVQNYYFKKTFQDGYNYCLKSLAQIQNCDSHSFYVSFHDLLCALERQNPSANVPKEVKIFVLLNCLRTGSFNLCISDTMNFVCHLDAYMNQNLKEKDVQVLIPLYIFFYLSVCLMKKPPKEQDELTLQVIERCFRHIANTELLFNIQEPVLFEMVQNKLFWQKCIVDAKRVKLQAMLLSNKNAPVCDMEQFSGYIMSFTRGNSLIMSNFKEPFKNLSIYTNSIKSVSFNPAQNYEVLKSDLNLCIWYLMQFDGPSSAPLPDEHLPDARFNEIINIVTHIFKSDKIAFSLDESTSYAVNFLDLIVFLSSVCLYSSIKQHSAKPSLIDSSNTKKIPLCLFNQRFLPTAPQRHFWCAAMASLKNFNLNHITDKMQKDILSTGSKEIRLRNENFSSTKFYHPLAALRIAQTLNNHSNKIREAPAGWYSTYWKRCLDYTNKFLSFKDSRIGVSNVRNSPISSQKPNSLLGSFSSNPGGYQWNILPQDICMNWYHGLKGQTTEMKALGDLLEIGKNNSGSVAMPLVEKSFNSLNTSLSTRAADVSKENMSTVMTDFVTKLQDTSYELGVSRQLNSNLQTAYEKMTQEMSDLRASVAQTEQSLHKEMHQLRASLDDLNKKVLEFLTVSKAEKTAQPAQISQTSSNLVNSEQVIGLVNQEMARCVGILTNAMQAQQQQIQQQMTQMALNQTQMQHEYSKRLEQSLMQMNKPTEPMIRPPQMNPNPAFNLSGANLAPQIPGPQQTRPFNFANSTPDKTMFKPNIPQQVEKKPEEKPNVPTFSFNVKPALNMSPKVTEPTAEKNKSEIKEDANNDSDGAAEDEDYDPHYEPLVKDAQLVEVKTGEENNLSLFFRRAKLYRMTNKEWKERGTGMMKILVEPGNLPENPTEDTKEWPEERDNEMGPVKHSRMIMRWEKLHKICLNQVITPNHPVKFTPFGDKVDRCCWVGNDYSDEEPAVHMFCIRFSSEADCNAFKNAVKRCESFAFDSESQNVSLNLSTDINNSTNKSISSSADRSRYSNQDLRDISVSQTNIITKMTTVVLDKHHTSKGEDSDEESENSDQSEDESESDKASVKKASSSPDKSTGLIKLTTGGTLAPIEFSSDVKNIFGNAFTQPQTNNTTTKLTFGIQKPDSATEKKEGSEATPFSMNKNFSFAALSNDGGSVPSWLNNSKASDSSAFNASGQIFGASKNANESKDNENDESCLEDDADYDPYYEPIVKNASDVEVKTGEEESLFLYRRQVKLYRFDENVWKERGTGTIKVLVDPAKFPIEGLDASQELKNTQDSNVGKIKHSRILMRRDQVHKICLNQVLSPNCPIKINPMGNSTNKICWVGNDFSDEDTTISTFCIKFSNNTDCNDFKEAVDRALKMERSS